MSRPGRQSGIPVFGAARETSASTFDFYFVLVLLCCFWLISLVLSFFFVFFLVLVFYVLCVISVYALLMFCLTLYWWIWWWFSFCHTVISFFNYPKPPKFNQRRSGFRLKCMSSHGKPNEDLKKEVFVWHSKIHVLKNSLYLFCGRFWTLSINRFSSMVTLSVM